MGKIVTLGEIMLRLSPETGIRLTQAAKFQGCYGGGEANVAISLANYGHETFFASKVPDNELGLAAIRHLQSFGVNTQAVLRGGNRLGTYYLETGVGERSSSVVYDRQHSSFAEMLSSEWDIAALFNDAELFHLSGITPALSKAWQQQTLELVKTAKQAGCKISFDMNYRSKLWSQEKAGNVIKEILPYVDYCSAGKLDAIYLLGIDPVEQDTRRQELSNYYQMIQEKFPNLSIIYSTERFVHSSSDNELVGTLWMHHKYYESKCHRITPIVDRVGGGDAFAGGILHGILQKEKPQKMIDFATAASALKHTVYGDCNQFNQQEVGEFLTSDSRRINR